MENFYAGGYGERKKGFSVSDLDKKRKLSEVYRGWDPNSEQEIFSMEELIQAFSMEHVAKNPAVFEIDKLNWINQHYMRQLDEEAFFAAAKPHMVAAGYMTGDEWRKSLLRMHNYPRCEKLF